ncbi:hypothetical protein BVG16_07625 [Paenibacillus selenitireducens]|uniref:Uncharacterized protein n=1 Tax=Paenibacillus selenitireducens TaxID=1324314 RepID=A0A1T2XL35_9BACL|nr:hypothetical protein [Paenibacillus selenitireducens]OPA80581.1 hypothetical protein BVG16_07625 [Paenibacillus selenitireducens]
MKHDRVKDDPNYWRKLPIEASKKFIHIENANYQQMSEEKFLETVIEENPYRESFLKMLLSSQHQGLFLEILKKLSLKGRRYFLFKINGFAIHRTSKLLNISSKKTQNYLNMMGNDVELIRHFALQHQIPPSWLELEKVIEEWEFEFIKYLAPSSNDIETLINNLKKLCKTKSQRINGFRLEGKKDSIYLKVELQESHICIDVYNDIHPLDLGWLQTNLERHFHVLLGYKISIIPGLERVSLICTNGYSEAIYPPGFCSHYVSKRAQT